MDNNFPYRWVGTPKVNPLLLAIINKDFKTAEILVQQGNEILHIDRDTFQRVLFEFLNDYEIMKFLVKHKFKPFYFLGMSSRVECQDEYGRLWGIIAKAYFFNNKQVLELLLSVGFDYFSCGAYWGSDGRRYVLWRYVFLNGGDRDFVNLLLSYGYPPKGILNMIDDPDYEPANSAICKYLKGNPEIVWKGYALCPNRFEEISQPKAPYIGIFTSKRKKELLESEYERKMVEYQNKKRVQQEFLNSLTQEDLVVIKERQRDCFRMQESFAMLLKNRNS